MRAPLFLSTTLLLASAAAPSLALPPIVHTSHNKAHAATQHPDIKHAATHAAAAHKSLHAATAATHHESIGIPSERATEIQTALIKQGYLTGEPSGQWDAQTAAAMTKLQSDNGWQTKITPDSRALIKLGLGPQQDTPAPPPTPQQP